MLSSVVLQCVFALFRPAFVSIIFCSSFAFGMEPLAVAGSSSFSLAPVRYDARSWGSSGHRRRFQSLRLALKRYAREEARPVLLLPGLASNDLVWDARVRRYSFARHLHETGYDVWIGNYRHTGTPGFRSESPPQPYHWTVDDLAAYDLPALIEKVHRETGQWPILMGHSLAAWVMEAYFSGLYFDSRGRTRLDQELGLERRSQIPAIVTVAGVYNLQWPKSLRRIYSEPVQTEADYYNSNYELEALTYSYPLYPIIRRLPSVPLDWVGTILRLTFDRVPLLGRKIQRRYEAFQRAFIGLPILSMFYYPPNTDAEAIRLYGLDGLEELGPRILEQLANTVRHRKILSFFQGSKPSSALEYGRIRSKLKMPYLVVAGTRDRLAHHRSIYRDGFLKIGSEDKKYIHVLAGHYDLLAGKNTMQSVIEPVLRWLNQRF